MNVKFEHPSRYDIIPHIRILAFSRGVYSVELKAETLKTFEVSALSAKPRMLNAIHLNAIQPRV